MKAIKIILLIISILFLGMNTQNYFMNTEVENEEDHYVQLVVLKEKFKDSDKVTSPKHLNEKPRESKRKWRKGMKKDLKKEFKNKIGALRLLLALSIILLIFSLGVAIAFGTFFTGGFSISAVPLWVFFLILIGLAGAIFSRKRIKKHKEKLKQKK